MENKNTVSAATPTVDLAEFNRLVELVDLVGLMDHARNRIRLTYEAQNRREALRRIHLWASVLEWEFVRQVARSLQGAGEISGDLRVDFQQRQEWRKIHFDNLGKAIEGNYWRTIASLLPIARAYLSEVKSLAETSAQAKACCVLEDQVKQSPQTWPSELLKKLDAHFQQLLASEAAARRAQVRWHFLQRRKAIHEVASRWIEEQLAQAQKRRTGQAEKDAEAHTNGPGRDAAQPYPSGASTHSMGEKDESEDRQQRMDAALARLAALRLEADRLIGALHSLEPLPPSSSR